MADALRPVAFDIIRSLCSLYDVYTYTIYRFFTERLSLRLGPTISRIETDLAKHELDQIGGFVDFSPDNFWGLGNRIVAIESIVSISTQMEQMRPQLEKLIPEKNKTLFFQ